MSELRSRRKTKKMGLLGLIMDANRAIKQNQAKKNDTAQTIVVQNKYSIDVPSYLSPTTKLSEDASLQYRSKTLDVTLQVVDEPTSECIAAVEDVRKEHPDFGEDQSLLDNIARMALISMFDIDKTEIVNCAETKINGMNAVMLNAFQKRTFLTDAIYGSFAVIEGKETLYKVIILAGGTSIKKLSDKLETVIYSFKEL